MRVSRVRRPELYDGAQNRGLAAPAETTRTHKAGTLNVKGNTVGDGFTLVAAMEIFNPLKHAQTSDLALSTGGSLGVFDNGKKQRSKPMV